MIDFSKKATSEKLQEFAEHMIELSETIGFRISARGWCYTMETERYINKDQFDKVEGWINKCRRRGYLPIDFVAEDSARLFKGVEKMDVISYERHILSWLNAMYNIPDYYDPNWWEGEKYYIQMIVEKVDLVTLAQPVLEKYHIPIANAKGWSSMLQRAEYARRFRKAEIRGLKCVLLYFGDHDPDGLRIADNIRKNLYDLQHVTWNDKTVGYNPEELIIDRIGLTYSFIKKNKLTWIDNLVTGRKKDGKKQDLSDPKHRNNKLTYVQAYIENIGIRKCEANACVTIPSKTRLYIDQQIEKYLGKDAEYRFKKKKIKAEEEINEVMEKKGINEMIQASIDNLRGEE